ncbi:uncharacterized protein At4g15970 isoform X3 [Jatropha curcas]|uniref:uncharacterized protein At4g15970 isoform X3 n=1 Tax=Jatropha curcas TaxID=180498 RepID=UPI0009D77770|nr:uncharacterized protein At4g15970 isoform X3 [Jatropha curcas]
MKGLLRSIKSPISLVFLIMVMLTIFFLFHKHLIPRTTIFRTRMPLDQYNSDGKDLLQVLRAASMPSRTVILTMVDKSWAKPGSIVDLFLESFKIGQDTELLLNHLVIVATDSTAFHYYVMWLRNPFPLFHGLAQMTIGCDSLYSSSYQDSDSEMASGGFFYIQADEKSIQFFNLWRLAQVLYPNTQNESLCETVLKEDFITMVDFTPMFLKTKYYGGFCHPHNDIGKIYTLHANCCDDLENKVHDIKIVFDELRNYRSILAEGNSLGALSYWGRAPERCRRSKT